MELRRLLSGSVMAIALAAFTACGGDDTSTSTSFTTQSSADTAVSADTVTDDTRADTSAEVTTVDANTASVEEIAAALAANGVSNPERWAREVAEYRPYDTSDPSLGELRDEFAKYNPDAATLEAIIASMTV
jgi:hypothetical protein